MLEKLPKGWTPKQLSDECNYERKLLVYLASQGLLAENTAMGISNALVDIINGYVEFLPIDKINNLIVSMVGVAVRDLLKDMARDIATSKLRHQSMTGSIDKLLKNQGLSGIN